MALGAARASWCCRGRSDATAMRPDPKKRSGPATQFPTNTHIVRAVRPVVYRPRTNAAGLRSRNPPACRWGSVRWFGSSASSGASFGVGATVQALRARTERSRRAGQDRVGNTEPLVMTFERPAWSEQDTAGVEARGLDRAHAELAGRLDLCVGVEADYPPGTEDAYALARLTSPRASTPSRSGQRPSPACSTVTLWRFRSSTAFQKPRGG